MTRDQIRAANATPVCPGCGKQEDNPYTEHTHHKPDCRVAQYLARLSLWENAEDA